MPTATGQTPNQVSTIKMIIGLIFSSRRGYLLSLTHTIALLQNAAIILFTNALIAIY